MTGVHRRKAGLLPLVVTLALVAPLLTTVGTAPADAAVWSGSFGDDDGSPHQAAIEALVAARITGGCTSPGDTPRFCPGRKITRGQMAAFLKRALDLPPGRGGVFTDTARSPFAADIDAVAAAGITLGCGTGAFCPDRPLTRGEMAALLVRAFAPDATPPADDLFIDDDDSRFQDQIEVLADLGITRGCNTSERHFCPGAEVTRGQMATFLAAALELPLPEVPVIEQPAPAPAAGHTDPLGLIAWVDHQRRFSSGTDHWNVVVCRVPVGSADPWVAQFGSERIPVRPTEAVATLERDAVPYFTWLSEGRYTPSFEAGGVVSADASSTDVWSDCEDKGKAKSAGAEGAFVVMDVPHTGGRGGSGWICTPTPCEDSPVLLPGSGRGLVVGAYGVTPRRAGVPPHLSIVVHELGHALDFPHSFPRGSSSEYTDPIDMMSNGKESWDGGPVGTLAVNRYAAGWVGVDRAAVHPGGTREYVIGGVGYKGTQLVAIPSGHAKAFTALGAVTRVGYDAAQPVEGITIHRVDQRPALCSWFGLESCVGTNRRHAPVGAANRTDHVLAPGQSANLGGVKVTVLGRVGAAFRVRVQGATSPFSALVPSAP